MELPPGKDWDILVMSLWFRVVCLLMMDKARSLFS